MKNLLIKAAVFAAILIGGTGAAAIAETKIAPHHTESNDEVVAYNYNYNYPDGYVCTKYTGLNVRYGPGTEYSVYTVFPKGDEIWWMDSSYSSNGAIWHQVSNGVHYGWVHSAYLCYY